MIIIEGPDNSGKTTLANQLSKHLGMEVVHSIKPGSYELGINRMAWIIDNPFNIYDRVSCISEAVYGPICRNNSVYGHMGLKVMFDFIRSNPLVIYCCCNKERALQFNGREDMDGVHENAEALYDGYEVIMGVLRVMMISLRRDRYYIPYNYQTDSLEDLFKECSLYHNDQLESYRLLIQANDMINFKEEKNEG